MAEERAAEEHRVLESKCKEILYKWFNEIGMLPRPAITVGRTAWEYSGYDDDYKIFFIDATWQYEGHDYRGRFSPPESGQPDIQIFVGNQWFNANTREQIGKALLAN
jgi:hypothetical protein